MNPETFEAVMKSGHKEEALEVPFDPGQRWAMSTRMLRPGRRGYPVRGTLDGCPFRSAVVGRSRKFWLLVPGELQSRADVAVGDSVTVELEPDRAPADIPSDDDRGDRAR